MRLEIGKRLTPEQFAALAPMMRDAVRENGTWIYVIQAGGLGGLLKVGRSRDIARRLKDLQKANGEELSVIGAWRDVPEREKELHTAAAGIRVRGEWFLPEPGLIRFAREMNEWRAR